VMPDAMTIRTGRILAAAGAVQPDPEEETIWTCSPAATRALDRAGVNWTIAAEEE